MHIPVLSQEVLEGLNLAPGKIMLDATINGGGHSKAVFERFGKGVRIVGIDLDEEAIQRSEERLAGASINLVCDSYVNMRVILRELGIAAVDAVLFDLGLSSDQFESGRGFSFQKDEPLLMTFKKTPAPGDLSAYVIVNRWEESSLETIIAGFGEERHAKRIARAIILAREQAPIETTGQLEKIIFHAFPRMARHGRIHPATKTFQAIRIAVNGELEAIPQGLEVAWQMLPPGGRILVISFHSLEDRIVKRFFKEKASLGGRLITKKPITATREEKSANPRSRSAKLRILEK